MATILMMAGLGIAGAAQSNLPPAPPLSNTDARQNWFVQAVYDLHLKSVEGREIRAERSTGGYAREPDFFEEVNYHDRASGRLLSTIRWERAQPDRIHMIEVYRYDDRGRLARRYTAWYTPHRREVPRSTWISLYAYNGNLVAYRQFDATDARVSEICEGRHSGKPVSISLWEPLDIATAEVDPEGIMTRPEYRACFGALPVRSAGKYLIPQ
jgi:hypothetical protein